MTAEERARTVNIVLEFGMHEDGSPWVRVMEGSYKDIIEAIRAAEDEAYQRGVAEEREAILQMMRRDLEELIRQGGDAHSECDLERFLEMIRARGQS